MLAADVGHPCAALRLVQGAQNLLFGMTLLRHFRVLLALFQKTTLKAHDSTYHWRDFRVLGHAAWRGKWRSGKCDASNLPRRRLSGCCGRRRSSWPKANGSARSAAVWASPNRVTIAGAASMAV